MQVRQLRRSTALGLGALLLAVPFLSSCARGFATERVYTPATGVNNQEGDVDVLGATIVSGEAGSGPSSRRSSATPTRTST
ncbi:MAG: hypothetical protein R2734_20695 [Nocardioides sp.]